MQDFFSKEEHLLFQYRKFELRVYLQFMPVDVAFARLNFFYCFWAQKP